MYSILIFFNVFSYTAAFYLPPHILCYTKSSLGMGLIQLHNRSKSLLIDLLNFGRSCIARTVNTKVMNRVG